MKPLEYLYNWSYIILRNAGRILITLFLLAGAGISYLCSGWPGLGIMGGIILAYAALFGFLQICEGANPAPGYRRGTWYQNNWYWWQR